GSFEYLRKRLQSVKLLKGDIVLACLTAIPVGVIICLSQQCNATHQRRRIVGASRALAKGVVSCHLRPQYHLIFTKRGQASQYGRTSRNSAAVARLNHPKTELF